MKIGFYRERVGSRSVKNFKKKGFFGKFKFWELEYVEEDVYEIVDDYKDEDIYKIIMDYKIVMRDVFEEKVEYIEKFIVEISVI